jgi:hypothetical protein
MNASTVRANSVAVVTPAFSQPMIPATYKMLAASVLRDGLSLDLYGTHDADGYEVCAISLAGTKIDLQAVLGSTVCDDMTAWCERHLASGAELRAASRADMRIDRHQWEREYRIGVAA